MFDGCKTLDIEKNICNGYNIKTLIKLGLPEVLPLSL